MRLHARLLFGFVSAPSALLVGCFGSDTPAENPPDASRPDVDVPDTGWQLPEAGAQDGARTSDATADGPQGPPGINLAPSTLDFGPIDCGAAPPPSTLSFTNTGGSALTYKATLTSGTVFALQGAAQGTVAPGQSATITVAPHAVPTGSTAGTPVTDTLTVTTNAPGAPSIAIALKVTPQGGSILIAPPAADFGQAFVGVQAPDMPLTIKNVGNKAVSVALAAPADAEFATTWTGAPTAASLAPGASLPGAVARFKPATNGAKSDASALVVQGPLCAPASPSVSLAGVGTTLPIAIAPGALAFGTTPCGSSGKSLAVTLTNSGATPVAYTSSLKSGASYSLQGASGTVPANGTATITVQPGPVPRDPSSVLAATFADTLTVTTGAGGGGAAATIDLSQTGSGAVLAVTMQTSDFGPVPVGAPASLPFSVANTGNVDADLLVVVSGAGFGFSSAPTQVTAGATAPGKVTYAAQPPYGAAAGDLSVSTKANLCQPSQPPPLSLTATSEGPVATADATQLSYSVQCGGATPPPQTLTVTNKGTSDLVLSGPPKASAGFSVTAWTSTPIAPGMQGTISVQASATPITGDLGGSARGGTLTYSTNEFGAPAYSVKLSAALTGANLGFYQDAAHATPMTSNPVVCGDPTPAWPWWECTYTGLTYYIYNSGNDTVTLGALQTSDPAHIGDAALIPVGSMTPSTTLAPQTTLSSIGPLTNFPVSAPFYQPPVCPKGTTSFNEWITYPVASGHVCVPLPKLTVVVEGDTPCP
jgi:hypothetical protein